MSNIRFISFSKKYWLLYLKFENFVSHNFNVHENEGVVSLWVSWKIISKLKVLATSFCVVLMYLQQSNKIKLFD